MKTLSMSIAALLAVGALAIPSMLAADDYAYTVRAGESWASITSSQCRAGTQPAALAQYNRQSISTALRPGTAIRIPYSLSNQRSARLQSVQGTVTVNGAAARAGANLAVGQTVVTGANGRADIVLDNGSVMRVGASTSLTITQLVLQGRSSNTGTQLNSGSVAMQVTRMNRDSSFNVSTVSAVAGVRGTYFYINFDPTSSDMGIATYTGRVDVGRTILDENGRPRLDENGNPMIDPATIVSVDAGHATTVSGSTGAIATPFPIPGRIQWADEAAPAAGN